MVPEVEAEAVTAVVAGVITVTAAGWGDRPRSASHASRRISRVHIPSPVTPRVTATATRSSAHPAGAAAAGAGYSNRNQSQAHPAGAAAAGAGYANNQGLAHPGAAGAAAGAGYANNHSGINGSWNGNNYAAWGAAGYGSGYGGGVGAWGAGSPMYGWGYSGYSNPYSAGYSGSGGGSQTVASSSPAAHLSGARRRPTITPSRSARPPRRLSRPSPARRPRRSTRPAMRSRRATTPRPCSSTSRRSRRRPMTGPCTSSSPWCIFAQGKYDQAAEPLYAVLSVAPGWDWTTLSGMYPDVDTYTRQLRALEANVRANPDSAHARFVLAYQYLGQGHVENAVAQLKAAVKLQPGDTLSAQLIAYYQPAGATQPPSAEPATNAAPAVEGKLAGTWTATPAKDAKIALAIQDDGKFNWDASGPGKPPTAIAGASTFADGVLTLAAKGTQDGALAGKVAWQDADHFTFRLVGAPPTDPGLKFGAERTGQPDANGLMRSELTGSSQSRQRGDTAGIDRTQLRRSADVTDRHGELPNPARPGPDDARLGQDDPVHGELRIRHGRVLSHDPGEVAEHRKPPVASGCDSHGHGAASSRNRGGGARRFVSLVRATRAPAR